MKTRQEHLGAPLLPPPASFHVGGGFWRSNLDKGLTSETFALLSLFLVPGSF